MSDTPADIAEMAKQIARAVQSEIDFWEGDPDALQNLQANVARAILAERSRCCAIATQPHPHDARLPKWSQGKSIAKAIRNGAKPD